MKNLHLNFGERSYDIIINEGYALLKQYVDSVESSDNVLLVSDSNVYALYGEEVRGILSKNKNVYVCVFEAGETSKNIDVLQTILKACVDNKLDRKGVIYALGGGVTGDMAGFAAAIYMRGIKFIQIPTTLLAQTDSSVGGKTAIDFMSAKNIVGAFKQPSLVYINTSTLNTLDKREFCAGMAEVIKYGVIYDRNFFDFLEENADKIKALNSDVITEVIYNCCSIKADVVVKDEKETSLRAILNFGHTIGHGIESAASFSLLHGECVALGMIGASHIAYKRGYIPENDLERIINMIKLFDLPISVDSDIKTEDIVLHMKNDKKKENNMLTFVLPGDIGSVSLYKDIDEAEIVSAIDYLRA